MYDTDFQTCSLNKRNAIATFANSTLFVQMKALHCLMMPTLN